MLVSRILCLTVVPIAALLFCGCQEPDKRIPALEERVKKLEAELRAQKEQPVKAPVRVVEPTPTSTPTPIVRSGNDPITDAEFTLSGTEKDDPFLGKANAEILFMAFYDYESESSRRFAKATLQAIRDITIPKSSLKFILRDFPLPNHPTATAAASFAQCAGEQGKYWSAFDLLNGQDLPLDISRASKGLIGINQKRLDRCVSSNRYIAEIQRDIADGHALGAQGVPSFFLGKCTPAGKCKGKFVRGAQPFGLFQKLMSELSLVDTH